MLLSEYMSDIKIELKNSIKDGYLRPKSNKTNRIPKHFVNTSKTFTTYESKKIVYVIKLNTMYGF